MSIPADGFVLRPPRVAPSNATSTGEALTGVLRDHKPLPVSSAFYTSPDDLFEPHADMYRASVLRNPDGDQEEYLVWAANSSSFAVLEHPAWTVQSDNPTSSVTIPVGTLEVVDAFVDPHQDGTDRLVVADLGGRSLAQVRQVTIRRGDTEADVVAGPDALTDFALQDADAGNVVLDAATLTALGGGVSRSRGDTIVQVSYILAAARFWWTRNDPRVTRFGWNGTTQRWEPFKGSPPRRLGLLLDGRTYELSPKPERFVVGETLPGIPGSTDSYALIRTGPQPDRTATIPEIRVVSDQVAKGPVDFASLGNPDAVLGVTNGLLVFNPSYVAAHVGQSIWYNAEQYDPDSNGVLGTLREANTNPLFLSPVPGPTERPFVRLGFRRPLSPIPVDDDATLDVTGVPEGSFAWSRTSGKIKLSGADIAKSDPDDPGFDVQYLSNAVYYDGVSLAASSLPTRSPVQLVDNGGNPTTVGSGNALYIPVAAPFPAPGASGVLFLPDGTGNVPDGSVDPTTRANGSGLVRALEGKGDTFLFAPGGAIEDLEVVEFESELPTFPFAIRRGRAVAAREDSGPGSRVALGLKDRSRLSGQPLFFLQAEVAPSVRVEEPRLYSRRTGPFTFHGGERLYFAIAGTTYVWDASTLVPAPNPDTGTPYTAEVVAASIQSVILSGGSAFALRGHVVLESNTVGVEIGSGPTTAFADRDFSAASILGFLPGWSVDSNGWLPDNGTSLGVFRSPLNKDRSGTAPDITARGIFHDVLLSDSLPGVQFFPINNPPLQDVAGYGENLFFQLVDGKNLVYLENFDQVLYDFGNGRIAWLEEGEIQAPLQNVTFSLDLGNPSIVPETLHPVFGTGLQVSENGSTFIPQSLGEDFILPAGGSPGLATLVERYGSRVRTGAGGTFTQGGTTFTDARASFVSDGTQPGFLLHVTTGDAVGFYEIETVLSETEVQVRQPFPSSASQATWALQEGFDSSLYNPGLVADKQYEPFNHLAEEPLKVRLLSNLGPTPPNSAVQVASRLHAVVTEAFQNQRVVRVRFAWDPSDVLGEASLTPLVKGRDLGVLANGRLFIPDIMDPYFPDSFSLRVGTEAYLLGTNLTVVSAFTNPTGNVIEVLDATGEIYFGDAVLADREGSRVFLDQAFRNPVTLPAGEAEYDPLTGALNLSSADMSAFGGIPAWFTEQLITVGQLDVTTSPMSGSFHLQRPLRSGQVVEAEYVPATRAGQPAGDVIREILPIFIQLEEATRVDGVTYTINPTGRTIADTDPLIWVGIQLQNFGAGSTASLNRATSTVTFSKAVPSDQTVQVNYAVLEAFGGEQTFTVSQFPIYRPPFFLPKGANSFVLESDRTADVIPGKLFRLGAFPYYIKSSSYDAGEGVTQVEVYPPYDTETGSRAPGNDVLSLLSDHPVTDVVDGVSTGFVSSGFLMGLPGVQYDPVSKGMVSILFRADLTRYAVAGHLLEIGGIPHLIVGSRLSEDGRSTKVDLSSPFTRGFNDTLDPVRISVRPVYPPNPRSFLGIFPLVSTEPYELVLFGERDTEGNELPGRLLAPQVHYSINADTGDVELLPPVQEVLQPGQRLVLNYTRLRTLAPFVEDGALILPKFRASFRWVTPPTRSNGLLGSTLVARYTFHSPDTFYYRVVPLSSYMEEVAQILVQRVSTNNPSGGAVVVSGPPPNNYQYGNLGLLGQRQDLQDQDRAARAFLQLYNEAIVAFEQVKETISGDVIGDRDGKFRFFVGRGKPYAPPGYEDDITGDLNPRFVWGDVFYAANGSFRATPLDRLVDPETAIQDPTTLEVSGKTMDPFLLQFYIDQQKLQVANDMDDVVLIGTGRPRLALGTLPGIPNFSLGGLYAQMWQAHVLSRLFPERTLAFTTLFPGLLADLDAGNPGVYSFLRMLRPPSLLKQKDEEGSVFGSTFGRTTGSVSNPALDIVQNITDIAPRERLPRARVWAYSPNGFPELDALTGSVTEGFATLIATPGLLRDFPLDADGNPDFSRLASMSPGGVPDVVTGDPELSNPGFQEFSSTGTLFKRKVVQQVALGRPSGVTLGLGNANRTLKSLFGGGVVLGTPVYEGVFVARIYNGCMIVLGDSKGNPLSGSDVLALGSEELSGEPASFAQGDTVFVIPPGSQDSTSLSNPPTVEEQEEFAENLPNYRPGFDVSTRLRKGEFADISLPSFRDPSPFGFKELLGQKTPNPLSAIEASVDFVNTATDPLAVPALRGQPFNDSGDYALPYVGTSNTELDRLEGVARAFRAIRQVDAPSATITQAWKAVFPDEIVGVDGIILDTASATNPPATLITSRNLVPVNGSYVDNSGVGDVRPYDLLLVQRDQGSVPNGIEGILSVANAPVAGDNILETPRFVTPTRAGDILTYTLRTAMSHVSDTFASGMFISEVITLTEVQTTFDITTIGGLLFNDGNPGTTGGLNNLFHSGNAIIIRLYQNGGMASPGALVEEIVLTGVSGVAVGGLGSRVINAIEADTTQIRVTTNTSLGFVANLLDNYDFTIDIDTYIEPSTDSLLGAGSPGVGAGTGSTTAFVDADRLTFRESLDLRTMVERGTSTASPGSVDITSSLAVYEIFASGALSSVNAPAEVNGGDPFTFLSRVPSGVVGTFSPGVGTGSCKTLGFEGHNNTPLGPVSDIIFAAVPSSEVGPQGVIASGTGTAPDTDTYIEVTGGVTGALRHVEPGDILVIKESSIGDGTHKAGTYLVRHAVPESGSTPGAYETVVTRNFGGSVFPKVVSVDDAAETLEITFVPGPLGEGPGDSGWDSSGRLYLVPNAGDITTVVSAQYSTVDGVNFLLSNYQDAFGAPLLASGFYAAVSTGMRVTGMRWVPISAGLPSPLPPNNTVGFDSGVVTLGGYRSLTLSNPSITGDATAYSALFTFAGTTLTDATGASPGPGDLGIVLGPKVDSTSFLSDETTPIYNHVATFMDVSGLTPTEWEAIHGDAAFWGGTPPAVNAVFPSDKAVATDVVDANGDDDGGVPGFLALAGVFLEPSFPRPTTDLNTGPKVVDLTTTVGLSGIGWRAAGDFSALTGEDVAFEVRRIRRFHEPLSVAVENLRPLRFAYEVRRGTVLSYSAVRPFGFNLTADISVSGSATQLGPFNDVDVNINAGDEVRIVDVSGNVLDTAEVSFVRPNILTLKAPGFTQHTPVAGDLFEVYLRTAPVPHEQSNQQLYDLVTDRKVHQTTAAYSTGSGGRVDVFNELRDNTVADFTLLGVQEGDIVVVDPAGAVEGPGGPASTLENGFRPVGDVSVAARAQHVPGGPNELDDNRGFYRVVAVHPDRLEVSGLSEFSGDAASPVVLGAPGQEFVVLPTITVGNPDGAANPNAPLEGQQDLRATRPAGADSVDPNSYRGNAFSIEPFSYTIIRPNTTFTEETVNLVLFIRERMLSWMENLRTAFETGKAGDYYVFQEEEHVTDLGSPTDPGPGLGVMSNLFLTSLEGEVGVSPFINTSDALSVLDRRVWTLDFRLDTQTPMGSLQPYTSLAAGSMGGVPGSGRPVLPDRVDDVLDLGQRLRPLRFVWVKFRANRINGSLQNIIRFEEQLPDRIQEQEDLLRLRESLDNT